MCLLFFAKESRSGWNEWYLLRKFEDYNISGEWFHPDPELMDFIDALKKSSPRKRDKGHRCPTDGCDVQKIWLNKKGEVIDELLSSVARENPLTHIVFNE